MYFNNLRTNLGVALLCTSSAIALSTATQAQDAASETVVVTGSRVIADAANSPTPLTIVTTTQLQATTPTTITAALNKLPAFIGSRNNGTAAGADANFATSALNLRNFGVQRTLVLLDGHRVTPSNNDGTVNIDNLPQMLMQRVDVVTGGASAVYGSDAVTGVVNFVLDKHFTGLKFDVNAGISNYSDAASYNVGVAGGMDLFGGRGHVEGDIRAFHQDGVINNARPIGAGNWLLTGAGSAANPYRPLGNLTNPNLAFGGKISCTGCAAAGQQFIANGVIGPFNPGTATGTAGINVGGDGVYDNWENATTANSQEEAFARFSYNLTDDVAFYVQGSATQSWTQSSFIPNYINTGNGTAPNQFYYTNPYLSAANQALLKPTTGSIFQLAEWFNGKDLQAQSIGLDRAFQVTAGLDGTFGNYTWSVFYTHGDDRLKLSDPQNLSFNRLYAADDAVATAGGGVACYVSTTTYASLYPGCAPINPFGPTALTPAAFNYIKQKTYFTQEQTLDNVGGSIAGDLFEDWAGPVKGALSTEARWTSLGMVSPFSQGPVDCTGLRLCNTNTVRWEQKVNPSLPTVSESVWEVAGEVNVPLLKNVPLVQELSTDIAGRYTDYSVSGSVETWKIGLDYHVNDQIRFRATNSIDIRAPSLYELFQPVVPANTTLQDIHTQSSSATLQVAQGNPNLVPEVARTYTAGVVLTPEFLPGLTASIDYYNINMKNAIGAINFNNTTVQSVCEASGGTSQYCALAVRPLPFSNTTTNNYPTTVYQYGVNAAFQRTEGWDIELDYGFQLGDVWADAPGSVNLRMVVNYSPVLESIAFPGSPIVFTGVHEADSSPNNSTSSKGHVTSFLGYNVGSWGFNLQDRWVAGYPNAYQYGLVYTSPRVNSVNYVDITIDKKFNVDGSTLDGYFTVQNIGNVNPPLALANFTSFPGVFYGGIGALNGGVYDKIGRYFTLGLRASL